MPKRAVTPPPAEDEPKYLTVVNPYPLHANMELAKDRRDFALWLACCTGKEPLCAFFHKPKSPNMIIVEVDRDFENFPGLLGEHKWANFLRKPTPEEATQSSKVFYCLYNSGRKVEKNGWKRVFIEEYWFQGWHPNNRRMHYLYPETSYCEPPLEGKTTHPLCRPLPVRYFPPPSKTPVPPVGSAQWLEAKAKGTLPERTPALKPRGNPNGPWMKKKKTKPTVTRFPLPDSYTSSRRTSGVSSAAPSSKAWSDVPLGINSPASTVGMASSNGSSSSSLTSPSVPPGLIRPQTSPSVPPGLTRSPTSPSVPPGLNPVPLRAPIPVFPQERPVKMSWSEEMDYEDDHRDDQDENEDEDQEDLLDDQSESVQFELGSQVNGGAFYGHWDGTSNVDDGWGALGDEEGNVQAPLPRRIAHDEDAVSSKTGSARTWGHQTSYDPWGVPAASPPRPLEEGDSDSEGDALPKAQSVHSWGAQTEHHPWSNPLPRRADVNSDDASAVEHQDLWQGWTDPKPEKILPGKNLCNVHGIVCKKGICKLYAQQLKEEKQREERRQQEEERRAKKEKKEWQAAAKERKEKEKEKETEEKEKAKEKEEKEKMKNNKDMNGKKSEPDGRSSTKTTGNDSQTRQDNTAWTSSTAPAPIEDWSNATANFWNDWDGNDDDAASVASTDRFAWSSAASVRSAGSARSNNTITSQSARSMASRAPTVSSSGGWDRGSTPWDPLPSQSQSQPQPKKPAAPQGVWGARQAAQKPPPPRAQMSQQQLRLESQANQQQRSKTVPQPPKNSFEWQRPPPPPKSDLWGPPPPPSATEQRYAPSAVSSDGWGDASAGPW